MAPAWIAWTILIVGFILPVLHVCVSRDAGPWRMPSDARCPFSPRVGWLVIILFLGPIGWVLFVTRHRRRKRSST